MRTLYSLRWYIVYLVVVTVISVSVSVLVVRGMHQRISDAPRIRIGDIFGGDIPVAVAPGTPREAVATSFHRIDQASPFVIGLDQCRSGGRQAVLYVLAHVQLPDGSWRRLSIPFTTECERVAADDELLNQLALALPY